MFFPAITMTVASIHCAYSRRDVQAELAWVVWLNTKTVTHLSSNSTRRWATTLMCCNATIDEPNRQLYTLKIQIRYTGIGITPSPRTSTKCQTPLHGHRLRTCCTTPPTDELTTILQLVVQQIHHQRTKICHIPTSWHVEMFDYGIAMWQICCTTSCRFAVSLSVGGIVQHIRSRCPCIVEFCTKSVQSPVSATWAGDLGCSNVQSRPSPKVGF